MRAPARACALRRSPCRAVPATMPAPPVRALAQPAIVVKHPVTVACNL